MNLQGCRRLVAASTIVGKSATACSSTTAATPPPPTCIGCLLDPGSRRPRALTAALSASTPRPSHGAPLLCGSRRGLCWVRRTPPLPRNAAYPAPPLEPTEQKHFPLTDRTCHEEEVHDVICDAKGPVIFTVAINSNDATVALASDCNVSQGLCDVDVAAVDAFTTTDHVVHGCLCDIDVDAIAAAERSISKGPYYAAPAPPMPTADTGNASAYTFNSAQISGTSSSMLNAACMDHDVLFAENQTSELQPTESKLSKGFQMGRMLNANHAVTKNHNGQEMRWFPYLDQFKVKDKVLTSAQILQMLGPFLLEERKNRIERVVANRTYSISPVVEGLLDLGNIAAVFRSADALGFQSVHVISNETEKRYKKNRRISMGSEKWLDAELFKATSDCFEELRSRGYRIAVASIANDSVPIFEMDWTIPTAVVFGNEFRGVSMNALQMSDVRCYIPMAGMVDSFNVSVAAGIVMHHAVNDRKARLGRHGDLSAEEQQILSADFYLRHSSRSLSVIDRLLQKKQEEMQTSLRSVLQGELEIDIELPEYLKIDLEKVSLQCDAL